mgnify:CR=1 FL=1
MEKVGGLWVGGVEGQLGKGRKLFWVWYSFWYSALWRGMAWDCVVEGKRGKKGKKEERIAKKKVETISGDQFIISYEIVYSPNM